MNFYGQEMLKFLQKAQFSRAWRHFRILSFLSIPGCSPNKVRGHVKAFNWPGHHPEKSWPLQEVDMGRHMDMGNFLYETEKIVVGIKIRFSKAEESKKFQKI